MSDIGHGPTEFVKGPFDFSVERTNVPLLSCQGSHCPLFFVLFFCYSRISHSRFSDWLFTHDPSEHSTDKHSHSCLFLASFTQRWPLSGTSQRGNSLFQCPKLLLLFDLYFLTMLGSHLLFEMPFSYMELFFFFHFLMTLQNFQVYFFHCIPQNPPHCIVYVTE